VKFRWTPPCVHQIHLDYVKQCKVHQQCRKFLQPVPTGRPSPCCGDAVAMDWPPLIRCWLTELRPLIARWWLMWWCDYSIVMNPAPWRYVRIGFGSSAAPALLQPIVTCHNCRWISPTNFKAVASLSLFIPHFTFSDENVKWWLQNCTLLQAHSGMGQHGHTKHFLIMTTFQSLWQCYLFFSLPTKYDDVQRSGGK